MSITIIPPVTITSAMVTASNVTDATNKMKAFDRSTTTQTTNSGSITYTITTGTMVTGVAILNCSANTVRVRLVDSVDGTVYDKTKSLAGVIAYPDWWTYFFGEVLPKTQTLFTDLPSYRGATVMIDIDAGSDTAKVGVIVIGQQRELPVIVQYGASIRAIDFSRKETDDFGDVTFIKRGNSRYVELPCLIPTDMVDTIINTLADQGLCLWICDRKTQNLTVFGWYQDLSTVVNYPKISDCNIELQRLI